VKGFRGASALGGPKKGCGYNGRTPLKNIQMDSFETLSLAMDLVELYDLHIPVEAVERFERVSDFIQYLHSALIHFLQVAA